VISCHDCEANILRTNRNATGVKCLIAKSGIYTSNRWVPALLRLGIEQLPPGPDSRPIQRDCWILRDEWALAPDPPPPSTSARRRCSGGWNRLELIARSEALRRYFVEGCSLGNSRTAAEKSRSRGGFRGADSRTRALRLFEGREEKLRRYIRRILLSTVPCEAQNLGTQTIKSVCRRAAILESTSMQGPRRIHAA
jgi:hypothetical protein